jgi:hypothetical protein
LRVERTGRIVKPTEASIDSHEIFLRIESLANAFSKGGFPRLFALVVFGSK